MGRALFVAHQNVMNLTALERVVGGQNSSAGIAEYGGHAFALQALPQDAAAGHALVFGTHDVLVLHSSSWRNLAALKRKTHQASSSGGAGFGSLQNFVFLSSLVPSTPERV